MFLRKLRFAASYRYIFIMLLKKKIIKKMTLFYKNWSRTGISWKQLSFKNKSEVFRFSHDVVTCDVDHDVSTAYC